MGLYPNRHVADAAFSVIDGDEQISVFTSQRAPQDRRDATHLGPIDVDVDEPMRVLRVAVDSPEHGVRAELTFTAGSPAIEEPHYWWRVGVRTIFDYTRFTQFGSWRGWIEVDGRRRDISPETVWGSRDRSWGIRPTGEAAPTGAPVAAPQFFWLWAPVNFPSLSTHFDVNEHGDGRRWHEVGALARRDGTPPETMRAVDYRIEWRTGTRWAQHFEYDLIDWRDQVHTITLRPRYEFQMSGLGYGHPDFGHGMWKGESVGGIRTDRLADHDTVHPPTHPRAGRVRRHLRRTRRVDRTGSRDPRATRDRKASERTDGYLRSVHNTAIAFAAVKKPTVEERRTEILEITCEVVIERGFAGTRIADVAKRLEVSSSLIHYHFDSKEQLLAEAFAHYARKDVAEMEGEIEAAPTALGAARSGHPELRARGQRRRRVDAVDRRVGRGAAEPDDEEDQPGARRAVGRAAGRASSASASSRASSSCADPARPRPCASPRWSTVWRCSSRPTTG